MWDIPFRQVFGPEETIEWEALRARIPDTLLESPDSVSWHLSASGIFKVKSAYRALYRGPALTWTSPLWKNPLPFKTKIFVWQLLRDCLPTAVEVAK
jgi:hypothetical protein